MHTCTQILVSNVWTNNLITLYCFWMIPNMLEYTFFGDTRYLKIIQRLVLVVRIARQVWRDECGVSFFLLFCDVHQVYWPFLTSQMIIFMHFIESHRKSAVVETRRKWRGGFIADVSFEIGSSDELSRIELTFPGPRQVYTLGVCIYWVLLVTPCWFNSSNKNNS